MLTKIQANIDTSELIALIVRLSVPAKPYEEIAMVANVVAFMILIGAIPLDIAVKKIAAVDPAFNAIIERMSEYAHMLCAEGITS